jgi:hypothetical protein
MTYTTEEINLVISQMDSLELPAGQKAILTNALAKMGASKFSLTAAEEAAVKSTMSGCWPTAKDSVRNEIVRFIDSPTTEEKWERVRYERNLLLTASDWSVLPDAPLTELEKTDALAYRQTLRDLTDSKPTPEEIVFPSVEVEKLEP